MVQQWQVEWMALCFLSSSHKQTGEKLHLSLSFPRGSVSSYHCTDRREKTLDEVFEGSWSKLFTHFPLLPALSALSSDGTRVGLFLAVPGASPTLQSSSFGSVAFQLYSSVTGIGNPSRFSRDPFPFQQHCGVGRAFPVLEVAGDVPELAEHRLCVGPGAPAAAAAAGSRQSSSRAGGVFPAPGGFSAAERLCRESEPCPGAYSNLA